MMDSAASTVSVTISGRIRDTVTTSIIVLPSYLDRTPEKAIAKTWRILHRNADLNADAIKVLDKVLPELVFSAAGRWSHAQRDYSENWVDPSSVVPESFSEVNEKNRELRQELHAASSMYALYRRYYVLYMRYKEKYQ